MNQNLIEEKRSELNLKLRVLLKVIEFIDGNETQYKDYVANSLDEEKFLEEQIAIINSAIERLKNIFKD